MAGSDLDRQRHRSTLRHFGVPEHLHQGIIDYVVDGVPTGDFLRACFANDFVDAVCRTVDMSFNDLLMIAKWIYNEAPSRSWGSPGVVKTWRGE